MNAAGHTRFQVWLWPEPRSSRWVKLFEEGSPETTEIHRGTEEIELATLHPFAPFQKRLFRDGARCACDTRGRGRTRPTKGLRGQSLTAEQSPKLQCRPAREPHQSN